MTKKPEQKEMEQKTEDLERELSELKKHQLRYQAIFDNSPEVIVFVDTQGRILDVNNRVFEWLGFKPPEIIGRHISELEFMSEATRELIADKFSHRSMGDDLIGYSIEVFSRDGRKSIAQVVGKTICDKNGAGSKHLLMISDITEQYKETEKTLEMAKKSNALFRAIPDLVFIMKRDGTFVDFKADSDQELALPRDQIIGGNIKDSGFSKEYLERVFHHVEEAIRTGIVQTYEYELMTPKGMGIYECRTTRLNDDEVLSIVRNITKHKNFEEELMLKNVAFESSLAAICTIDVNGMINHVNPAFLSLWGYNAGKDVVGRPVSEFFVNSKDADAVINSLNESGEWSGEFSAGRADGTSFISQGLASVVRDLSGKIVGYQSTNLDISERKRSEDAIRVSEQRYRALFEYNNDAVFIFDLNGIYQEANEQAAVLLGCPVSEITGRPISDFTALEDQTDSRSKIESLLKGEKFPVYERNFRRKDGREFPAEVNVALISDSDGKPMHFQSIVRDISVRKQSAMDIEKRQIFLESLLNAIPEAVITLDPFHKIVEWNPGAEKMFGYKREEVIGKNIDNLIARPEVLPDAQKLTRKVMSGNVITPHETVRYRKDGASIHVIVTASPIKIRGELQGIVAIYIDISMQKKIESEFRKADKLESLAILAGGIAHDFNNILASMLVNIGLFYLYKNDEGKLKSKLKEVESAILRARDLTHQLLTFSKGNAPVKNPASIRELLEEMVNFCLSGSNVKSRFFAEKNLWKVEIDEGQISQVIQNIVINAVQAMPEGGTIEIRAVNADVTEIKALPLNGKHFIRIEFKDHGIGIPDSHLNHIFDPFFTTKQKGGGLGLATAFSIIKNHDGLITVRSEMGKGTTFHVYLPAYRKRVKMKKVEPKNLIRGKGKILLMDDEEMILDATGELLRIVGYEVFTAAGGSEALEIFKNAEKNNEPFGCVILDLTIPDGLGGRETLKELKKIKPEVKAIASSGYSSDPIISEYKKFGFSGAIPKPYDISELSTLVSRIMAK